MVFEPPLAVEALPRASHKAQLSRAHGRCEHERVARAHLRPQAKGCTSEGPREAVSQLHVPRRSRGSTAHAKAVAASTAPLEVSVAPSRLPSECDRDVASRRQKSRPNQPQPAQVQRRHRAPRRHRAIQRCCRRDSNHRCSLNVGLLGSAAPRGLGPLERGIPLASSIGSGPLEISRGLH